MRLQGMLANLKRKKKKTNSSLLMLSVFLETHVHALCFFYIVVTEIIIPWHSFRTWCKCPTWLYWRWTTILRSGPLLMTSSIWLLVVCVNVVPKFKIFFIVLDKGLNRQSHATNFKPGLFLCCWSRLFHLVLACDHQEHSMFQQGD